MFSHRFVTAVAMESRLVQAFERTPGLRVVAAANMPGEPFSIDLDDGPTIYFDGTAPVLRQRRFLATAIGVLLAEPQDRDRYMAHAMYAIRAFGLCTRHPTLNKVSVLPTRSPLRLVRDSERRTTRAATS